MSDNTIFNVFERGLRRGEEKFPNFSKWRRFAYVESPLNWRVFLRSCAFIRIEGSPKDKFIVVKSTGRQTWEPPKGLLEGKDLGPREPIINSLVRNIRREIEEEAAVHRIKSLTYTGLVLQGQEESYPPNWYFQYHIFEVTISQQEWTKIQDHFKWIEEHPSSFARMKRDLREKDSVAIYNSAAITPLTVPLGQALVELYLNSIKNTGS